MGTDRDGRSCKSLSTWGKFVTWVWDIVDSVWPPQLYWDLNPSPVIEKDIWITWEAVVIGAWFLLPGGKKESGERVLKDLSKIVNGHAINHLPEFEKFGIKTVKELEEFWKNIINSAIKKWNIKSLSNWRTMIWDDITETLIFRDPWRKDFWTMFIHNMEKTKQTFIDYINKQL